MTLRDAAVETQVVADAFENSLVALRTQYARNLLLTAGMAHELRSPLHSMMSEVSVALLRERAVPDYTAVLESLLDDMRDLGRVVDNLITLTALAPGGGDRSGRRQGR
jgi:two-component system heavy metal sensor histidine kinase CusS